MSDNSEDDIEIDSDEESTSDNETNSTQKNNKKLNETKTDDSDTDDTDGTLVEQADSDVDSDVNSDVNSDVDGIAQDGTTEQSKLTNAEIDKKQKEKSKKSSTASTTPVKVKRGRKPIKKTEAELKTKKISKKTAKSDEKKRPGRPRKNPKKEPIAKSGIVKQPSSSDDHIELVYDKPIYFKKIFQFFKSLAASQIQILFRAKDIILYAEDHYNVSKIRIRIDASKLNFYYCKKDIDIGIPSKDMELIVNKADKDYTSILLLSNVLTKQRSISVSFDNDMEIPENHTVELIGTYNKMEQENEFTNEDYKVQFELPTKYFKKMVNDIKTMSNQLSIIQEDNQCPLVFEYITMNKKIQSKYIVRNNNKVKLNSKLSDNESFRVDVEIDNISPISKAQIADEITIMVDEKKPFMTRAYIDDKTIEIKTLTDIIDERPSDDSD